MVKSVLFAVKEDDIYLVNFAPTQGELSPSRIMSEAGAEANIWLYREFLLSSPVLYSLQNT